MRAIDKSGMTEAGHFAAEGFDAPEQMEATAAAAKHYVSEFPWCREFKKIYYDRGIPQAAVFYCEIDPNPPAEPDFWVVFGDLPPLYLATDLADNGAQAFASYTSIMQDFIDAARRGEPLEEYPPLATRNGMWVLDPTPDNLDALDSRLCFIRDQMLVEWQDELTGWKIVPSREPT